MDIVGDALAAAGQCIPPHALAGPAALQQCQRHSFDPSVCWSTCFEIALIPRGHRAQIPRSMLARPPQATEVHARGHSRL